MFRFNTGAEQPEKVSLAKTKKDDLGIRNELSGSNIYFLIFDNFDWDLQQGEVQVREPRVGGDQRRGPRQDHHSNNLLQHLQS